MNYREKIQNHLEESYNHIEPFLHDSTCCPTLHAMCANCEFWNGKEHDYSECREKPCFINFLGYEYMAWSTSWE